MERIIKIKYIVCTMRFLVISGQNAKMAVSLVPTPRSSAKFTGVSKVPAAFTIRTINEGGSKHL
jgi:hypothetical protein